MRIWFALLVAPVLALADQGMSLAATNWACAAQRPIAVHLVHALFLIPVAASIVPAWRLWRVPVSTATERPHSVEEIRFLAGIAAGTAAISAAAIVAMWMTTWVIAPCYS